MMLYWNLCFVLSSPEAEFLTRPSCLLQSNPALSLVWLYCAGLLLGRKAPMEAWGLRTGCGCSLISHHIVSATFIFYFIALQVSANGNVLRSEIVGSIKMRVFLSGMPELRLGLNDKVLFDNTGREYFSNTFRIVMGVLCKLKWGSSERIDSVMKRLVLSMQKSMLGLVCQYQEKMEYHSRYGNHLGFIASSAGTLGVIEKLLGWTRRISVGICSAT